MSTDIERDEHIQACILHVQRRLWERSGLRVTPYIVRMANRMLPAFGTIMERQTESKTYMLMDMMGRDLVWLYDHDLKVARTVYPEKYFREHISKRGKMAPRASKRSKSERHRLARRMRKVS